MSFGLGYGRKLLGCAVVLLVSLAGTAELVSVDPTVRHQVFEGFGEGTMDQFTPYYYKEYPAASRTDYLDKLFTLNNHGLGLTICRVLMPVGDAPDHAHMSRFYGQFNQCPPSFEPEDGEFSWDDPRHAEILWKIRGAADRGTKMWAQWYSYPYWMTVSGCTAGHTDGNQNNLRTDMEGRFAEHVCQVLAHFRDSWNVDFDYLNVINEPEADWWTYGGGQPGSRVTEDQAIRLIQQVQAQLPSYNLNPKLVAYDAAWADDRTAYLNTLLNASIADDLDVLSCHQYTTSEAGLFDWKSLSVLNQKSLWQTEWGDWEGAQYPGYTPGGNAHAQMMNYANKIHEALSVLKAAAWVMWEPEFIFDSQTQTFQPRKAYWAVAQYSRHVRPGMQMIHTVSSHPDIKTTAWLKPSDMAEQELVLVTVNSGASTLPVDYDLRKFHLARIDQVRRTSSTQSYAAVAFSQPVSDSVSLNMPAESITTLVVKFQNCDPLQADIIHDCIVDMQDLERLAQDWLMNDASGTIPGFADITGDKKVNLDDAAVLSAQWQDFPAFAPIPANGAAAVNPAAQVLRWSPNPHAVSHQVYLGTDAASVSRAGQGDPEAMGQVDRPLFVPTLLPNQSYAWRIDAVNESGMVSQGPVWEFTTVDPSPDPDLVGYWRFDEDSGTRAADASGYHNDGSLLGNPVWKPGQGKIGGAIELDGAGDAVEMDGIVLKTDNATFTAWVHSYTQVPWAGIVYSRNTGTNTWACGIHYEDVNRLRYTWNNNSPLTWDWDAGLTIPLGEWVFVAAAVQPDSTRLYLYTDSSGLREAKRDLPHWPQTLDNLKIGWDSLSGDRFFHGMIDEVRVYQRALSKEEIAALIQAGP